MSRTPSPATLHPATPADVPVLHRLVLALAEYEQLSAAVEGTEAMLADALFGPRPVAEALLARVDGEPVAFALWFHNYSTFLGRRGLYLEDLFVLPHWRGRGIGRQLLAALAAIAVERHCGRMEWSVLDWNEPALRAYRAVAAMPMEDWTTYRLTGESLRRLAAEAQQ